MRQYTTQKISNIEGSTKLLTYKALTNIIAININLGEVALLPQISPWTGDKVLLV